MGRKGRTEKIMKKILLSLGTLIAVGAIAAGGTIAFFQDTETSSDNIFVAGSVDLKVDHTYAEYNGEECNDCVEGVTNLIVNGGFEEPALNSGQWQVYPENPNDEVPGWDVTSGAGIEIQSGGNWGAPIEDSQLAELDSHTPGQPTSGIEQIFSTTPGQRYRLTFYHSPRPGNGPSGGTDNAIELDVLVTSVSGTLVNDTIGQSSYSGSGTVWTEHVYDFVALDTETTIRFTDAGSQPDTLGGYLDDVSVVTLTCDDTFTHGGTCTLWSETDLTSETFWNFNDVKPGDWGKSMISLHVYDNDSYACLFPGNIQDDENGVVDPEIPAGDNNLDGIPNGELSGELEFFLWHDQNTNNQYDQGETVLAKAGTPFNQIQTELVQLSLAANSPIDIVGVEWCAGAQSGPQNTGDAGPVTCDGSGMGNIAQTDKIIADFVAYAVQQRNNPNFSCADVVLDNGGGGGPVVADSYSTGFEPPTYSTGNINGQDGWSMTGPYDVEVVDDPVVDGLQSLRISNAVTSGAFGDQTFAPELTSGAGETGVGTENRFEAEFELSSTQLAEQPGLSVSVSPDDGNGSRMSFLRFSDEAGGIRVTFFDVTNPGPLGTGSTFVPADLGLLDRNASHTIKFVMNFVDGPANDVVEIYINGSLVHTGTSWEDYYRYDPEQNGNGNQLFAVDTLIFMARGTAAPGTSGGGYIFDNVSLWSGSI